MPFVRTLAIAAAAAASAACAYTPHEVPVTLDSGVAASTVGAGTTLRLRVIDDRDSTELGNRGAGIAGASVTAAGLMDEFTRAVRDGFERKGYTLTDTLAEADAALDVSLRSVNFQETMGFWTVGADVEVAINAEAERAGADFRESYRVSDEERQFAISTGDGITDSINVALSATLQNLFEDETLDAFLTTPQPGELVGAEESGESAE